MSVHESRGNLSKALKELLTAWAQTRQEWDDPRAEEFERQYIFELETNVRQAGSAMEQIGVLLNQVRRDCE